MALRNLEEQVLYLTKVVEQIQQVLGNALPDPIPGPQGDPGEQGVQGEPGPQGFGIVGYGTQLPASGRDGDWFILKTSTMTGIDYVMYRCVLQHWVAQFSMRGPAGPIANATEVVANPNDPMSEELKKVKIDGVTYGVPTGNYVKLIDAPEGEFLTDEQKNAIKSGAFINGTFLGLKNPVFFPARTDSGYSVGIVIGAYPNMFYTNQLTYAINEETNEIGFNDEKRFELSAIYSINGKMLPNYPSSPNYRRKLCYKTNNNLSWENDVIVRHNVTIEVNSNDWLTFMIINDDPDPITDISEILEERNQLIGGTAVLNDGYNLIAVTIEIFGEGDLAIDIGGGYKHIDYNDDITDITDHQTTVIY